MKKTDHSVLRAPMITEKSTQLREGGNLYCFRVAPDATKIDIRRAVERIFGVKVECVRTMNVQGKLRRRGRIVGRRPGWRKAFVRLKEGEKPIEYFEGS
jgi:large subunit ribosomal protein L23